MTTENPTKPNGDPKTRQKHPKKKGSTQKTEENPKYHESTPKVPLSLPEVLQNPQFTLFQHDDHGKPNKTRRRPQNTSKTPQTRTGSNPKMKEKPKSHRSTPKVPLNLPDVLPNPQFTLFHHDDQHVPN